MPRIFALLASMAAVLFMFVPLTSISAEETQQTQIERAEKTLCERLPALLAELDSMGVSKHVQPLTEIKKACDALVLLRAEKTLERFRALRDTVESAEVSFEEIGVRKEEIALFEQQEAAQIKQQEAAQRFLFYFGGGYKAVARNIGRLEDGSLDMFTLATKKTLQDFLGDDYGGLKAFLDDFKKASFMFREILTYRKRIVLCEGEKLLPDVFWNAVSDAHESTGKARFGNARAAFGKARGLLSTYTENGSLCVKTEAQTASQ